MKPIRASLSLFSALPSGVQLLAGVTLISFSGVYVKLAPRVALGAFCSLWFALGLFCRHISIHLIGPGLSTLLANFQVFFLTLPTDLLNLTMSRSGYMFFR